jgi:hypothetical protein
MSKMTRDPLLATATIGTIVVRVVTVIGMIGLGIGMAVVAAVATGYMPDAVIVDFDGLDQNGYAAAIAAMFLGIISLGLMFDFVSRLAQIIATVGDGDPFIAANAERLTRMGWLALAIQIVSFVAGLLGDYAEKTLGDDRFSMEFNLTLSGLALAVILFILARVFRKGADMRAELEGTV